MILFRLKFLQCFLNTSLTLTLIAGSAQAQAKDIVSIQNPWVRPASAGQDVGAAYMTLISTQDATLVHIECDVTKSVEIHSMVMEKNVMKMRMLETLALTASKPYKLEPGGYHLMLFDLKKPLTTGQQVNFELTFKNKNNAEFKQKIKVSVKNSASDSDKKGNAEDMPKH